MEDDGKISRKDVYQIYLRFQHDTEVITWNRFYIFLVFNSILAVSWAASWPSTGRDVPGGIYYTLAAIGMLSGLIWAALGYRGRKFVEKYADQASQMEQDLRLWTADLINVETKTPVYMPMTESNDFGKTLRWRVARSRPILIMGPIVVAVFHGLMLASVMGWSFR